VRRPRAWVTPACALVVLLLLVLAWQVAIWARDIPPYAVPTPAMTLTTILERPGILVDRALRTLGAGVAGLAVSTLIAVTLALVVVRWPVLARPVTAYALVIRTLPIVGIAPLITLIAGKGVLTSVVCVVVVTAFTLFVAAVQGLRTVPGPVGDLTALYDSSLPRTVLWTWLPSAVGGILVGLRICAPLAVLAAILAEWLSGRTGIGNLMTVAQSERDITMVWAATVTAALLGLIAYALPGMIAGLAERRGLAPVLEEAS
jgi:ABC-type nitrate/sulfonate/bicarbonate transport system permease component